MMTGRISKWDLSQADSDIDEMYGDDFREDDLELQDYRELQDQVLEPDQAMELEALYGE